MHYNDERPHRSLNLRPPAARGDPDPPSTGNDARKIRLGGLLSEYCRATWQCDVFFEPHTTPLLWNPSVHCGISLRGDMKEVSFAHVSVLDLEAREVALRDLYHERPAVIVWLRHYG